MEVSKVRAKLKTIGTADINATATMAVQALEWQTQRFIRTVSCKAVP